MRLFCIILLLLCALPRAAAQQPLTVTATPPNETLSSGMLFTLEIRIETTSATPITPRITIPPATGLRLTETFPVGRPTSAASPMVTWAYFQVLATTPQQINISIGVDDTLGHTQTVVVPVFVNGLQPIRRIYLPLVRK